MKDLLRVGAFVDVMSCRVGQVNPLLPYVLSCFVVDMYAARLCF